MSHTRRFNRRYRWRQFRYVLDPSGSSGAIGSNTVKDLDNYRVSRGKDFDQWFKRREEREKERREGEEELRKRREERANRPKSTCFESDLNRSANKPALDLGDYSKKPSKWTSSSSFQDDTNSINNGCEEKEGMKNEQLLNISYVTMIRIPEPDCKNEELSGEKISESLNLDSIPKSTLFKVDDAKAAATPPPTPEPEPQQQEPPMIAEEPVQEAELEAPVERKEEEVKREEPVEEDPAKEEPSGEDPVKEEAEVEKPAEKAEESNETEAAPQEENVEKENKENSPAKEDENEKNEPQAPEQEEVNAEEVDATENAKTEEVPEEVPYNEVLKKQEEEKPEAPEEHSKSETATENACETETKDTKDVVGEEPVPAAVTSTDNAEAAENASEVPPSVEENNEEVTNEVVQDDEKSASETVLVAKATGQTLIEEKNLGEDEECVRMEHPVEEVEIEKTGGDDPVVENAETTEKAEE